MPSTDIRDAFFDELYNIAAHDKNVILLTADMGALGLERFKKDLSSQYINVGVAEQNMVSIAAGLSLSDKKVFIYSMAAFVTMRCYEHIKVDISGMRLPVTIIGAGPGIAYSSDGPTHHSIQDVSIMRALPGMLIFTPPDSVSASAFVKMAYKNNSPVYIRLDKGKFPFIYSTGYNFSDGLSLLKKGRDLLIITAGVMVHQAFKVAEELARHSIDAGIVDLFRIKPVNEELLLSCIGQSKAIITLEEHSVIGGIGSVVNEVLAGKEKFVLTKHFAIPDKNCEKYGDRDWMRASFGLDIDTILTAILAWDKWRDAY